MNSRHSSKAGNPDPSPCVIVGCGGHGRVVLDILQTSGVVDVAGFVDSNPATHGRRIDGKKVFGPVEMLPELRQSLGIHHAIVAIGNNGIRREFADRLARWGFHLINAVHPTAIIARNATLGKNVVVAAGATVCCHCQIGDSVILNTACVVDHESSVGVATHVCPGARVAGRVLIESGVFVGIGSSIIQSLRIGYEAVIGAGAVVIHDVRPLSTVVGVPAKPVKSVLRTPLSLMEDLIASKSAV